MKTWIFDIDGTLANTDHRKRFLEQKPKDWSLVDSGCVDLRAQRDAAEGSANDAWRHAAAQSLASYPAVAILRARWLESAKMAQAFATENPQTPEQWRAYGAAETQFALADELESIKHTAGVTP